MKATSRPFLPTRQASDGTICTDRRVPSQGQPRRLTSREASAYLGVSLRVMAELRATRQIAYFKHGHRTVSYDATDLDRYLDSRRIEAIQDCRKGYRRYIR